MLWSGTRLVLSQMLVCKKQKCLCVKAIHNESKTLCLFIHVASWLSHLSAQLISL